MMKKILALAVIAGLTACSGMEQKELSYDEALAGAKMGIEKANKSGVNLWRDTESTLGKAEELNKSGKAEDKAMAKKLAMQAYTEVQMAQKQAMDQKNVKPWQF